MKKVLGILALMTVFGLGFGAGQYYHDNGPTIPGLAMASSQPTVRVTVVDFSSRFDDPYQWGISIDLDRPLVAVDKKSSTRVVIYTK